VRVANVIVEGRWGGPHIRIAMVAGELKRRHGIETVVIMPDEVEDDARGFKAILDRHGVAYRQVPLNRMTLTEGAKHVARFAGAFVPQVVGLARVLRAEKIDVVHANSLHQPYGPLAGRLAGCGVLWHCNDCSVPAAIRIPMAALAWRVADLIPVSVEAAGRYAFPRRYAPGPRFPLLYAPVDIVRFSPDGPRAAVPAGKRVVVTTGNMSPVKGTDTFLQAAPAILARHPDVELWVVGDRLTTQPAFAAKVEALAAAPELRDRVKLLGRRSDVVDILRAADVYVCSSRNEACPISVLEAMGTARPIVATNVGGVPELVTEGVHGRLVPREDPAAMAAAVSAMLDDPAGARAMGDAARARAVAQFTLDQAAEAHVRAYTHAVALRDARRA
jgi:glycosyltransferase involved in cell wall biosynthesis